MSTQAQSSSPFSRLSRLAFPFKSNPSSPLSPEPQDEDWYIPYNGPYEPPKEERSTDSWGHLVSGWLMEGEERGPRARAMSNASRPSGDQGSVRKNSRVQAAFIKLDQAGGVGDVPAPARPRRSQEPPVHHRASLASILSFGKQKSRTLHHSPSAGTLRDRFDSVPPVPQEAINRQESTSQLAFPRRHPYAYATPAPPPVPVSSPVVPPRNNGVPRFSVQLLDPLARKPSAPAYLLPARKPSRLSIKASMSTPNLRAATGAGSVLPKGKQRWFSAETWCDALILPRPRFALRVMDSEGGSGRIVSPPGSPIWPPGTGPYMEEQAGAATVKSLKKSQSAIQLTSRPEPPSPPRFVPARQERRPEPGPSNIAQPQPVRANANPPPIVANADTHLKPFRPKSWALDDLALPSPVPSLAKVLEDGKRLEADRQAWQRQAAKSFADSRARTVSRARSKSIGARVRSHAREPSAFEALAEVTLLGSQKRRPTVHVRVRPPRSDGHTTSSGGGTTALGTFTSASHAHSQPRSRSHHGHSASMGSVSQPRSDESFMWTPGHGRNHSLGKSAMRIVRTTATTAAGLCGISGSPSDDERGTMDEKGAAIEEALRHDGTKIIHLRDQVAREHRGRDGGVVMVTTPDSGRLRVGEQGTGPGGSSGVSPTPSGLSTSAEGVGIAISSPVPREVPFEKEPIRIPDHPYAQGAGAYSYYDHQPGRAPILPSARTTQQGDTAPSPTSTTGGDSITKHRQPVMVHPYSPYTQVQHPFSAITGTDAGPSKPPKRRPSKHLDVYSPKSSMFAELSPGTIREIMPDEIQYSPYIPTPPIRVSELTATGGPSTHPYASSNNRLSEWGFADALSQTLRPQSSVDSGLGTSEAHEIPALPEHPTFTRVLDHSSDRMVISPNEESDEETADMLHPHSRLGPGVDPSGRRRPKLSREVTQGSSNHTLASSPMSSINPPAFRPKRERSFTSTDSSPGVVSNQSSPPLSPRPTNSSDDLERFRDLFYRPPESRTPSSEDSLPPVSRRPSGSIPIELNARSTRSLSGLTTLARQLSVNMEEMQDREYELEEADRVSPMWGTRYGGLAGQRPDDLGPDPPGVLSQSSSRSGYLRGAQSPLRLPLDEDMVLSQPIEVVPEDVESSRASSMLELPIEDDDVRVGEVEALHTPPAHDQPARFSTHLAEIDYNDNQLSPTGPEDERSRRIVSQQSSLGVPLSSADAARSSFMTNTSGMSRLSDFPAPPSQITASHLSILNAYYGDNSRDSLEDTYPSRPGLVREASQATFGRPQMGEAL
ncbi:hypothetical protein K466DRAFT_503075 [Polyporus arcularius HHB13444]|uniref:Uncharacterized protein n=1 Tax=Polyporus arcularius HHB13444 TaxID=1314778 RepID=A0A5C3NV47_9APHY|nr:hypothetical protein K466DRAFT_503075 [Polyporus arcularius HHB13444]